MSSKELKKEQKFRYFKDEDCREPVYSIQFPDPVIRGSEKAELTIFAKNVTPDQLTDIQFTPNDPDLTIEQSSEECSPFGIIKVKFVFTPKADRKNALESEFSVRGRAIVRGNK